MKLIVYDMVIRAKLMYGLETLEINKSIIRRLAAFKGLRKILKLDTTYGQMVQGSLRTNSNEEVIRLANSELRQEKADLKSSQGKSGEK